METWYREVQVVFKDLPGNTLGRVEGDAIYIDTLIEGLMDHEVGHIWGFPHSCDRQDVMYPVITGSKQVWPCSRQFSKECRTTTALLQEVFGGEALEAD
jgi:predicted Zn-dependent protease